MASQKQIELARELGIKGAIERLSAKALSRYIDQAIEVRKRENKERFEEADELDLLYLAEEHTTLRKTAWNNYAGSCPMPGCNSKDDGFWVNTYTNTGGCRRCDWPNTNGSGSGPIGFIRALKGLDAFEALDDLLGGAQGSTVVVRKVVKKQKKQLVLPSREWRQQMGTHCEDARNWLVQHQGRAMEYLMEDRGLSWETIADFGIGAMFNPLGRKIGLAIVIPWMTRTGEVTGVSYRLVNPIKRQKNGKTYLQRYDSIAGSKKILLGSDLRCQSCILLAVEGEINAFSCYQIARLHDLPIDVVSFGARKASDNTRRALAHIVKQYKHLAVFCDEAKDARQFEAIAPCVGIASNHDANELLLRGELLDLLNGLTKRPSKKQAFLCQRDQEVQGDKKALERLFDASLEIITANPAIFETFYLDLEKAFLDLNEVELKRLSKLISSSRANNEYRQALLLTEDCVKPAKSLTNALFL